MYPSNTKNALKEQFATYHELLKVVLEPWKSGVLPNPEALARARQSLKDVLPSEGLGLERVRDHILQDIVPGFNAASLSPNYYGFVTGGVTPAALFADNVVSIYDQNVQVHLSDHSIATDVEFKALSLLTDLLGLDRQSWQNGTFTTGATASNIMGLACGREFVLRAAAAERGSPIDSVGEYGFFEVMQAAGLSGLQVLSTMPHSSLGKAAGILGIGRANLKGICTSQNPLEIDMQRLEEELARPDRASIVVISCGEVNTGHFATAGREQMQELRKLCDKYGAWLHVDGAFGIFGRILNDSTPEFASITRGCAGLEMADSITGDAHKFLNVPYDCGFFLCRHPSSSLAEDVFRNANAAYLSDSSGRTPADEPTIPSPLNVGIENSRRFRALPVYASLLSYGKDGYRDLLERQIRLARTIAGWLFDHPAYTALPVSRTKADLVAKTYTIVLFRANEEALNRDLTRRINATSKMFVSGTSWEGKPACRIAVSNWRVEEQRDIAVVMSVLERVVQESSSV
ncbi:Aromatic-L-amino-acid decarboxylase [Rasamsonia emersonii CBS 393.64]|uniref:Aromatic-L-amino-acid decarboxylase n=1 Tax=Rasamsonia emersonii (strain ATCC 16479 / CBS 393.64 / IMI 116815) TaxID=1408163 RepID=A0A0F4YZH6_RASE3|nr:Aromatic-L-amino-acid decarboxylase [Rasamsonia emersonii CBS 393.64]KKA23672.1 Aromatic-L-amino-acid decarboxylase [Rasamsonia emersonii CBS 393.64]